MQSTFTFFPDPFEFLTRILNKIRESAGLKIIAILLPLVVVLISTRADAQIVLLQDYQNQSSAPIGTFQGINFREGGFSGLLAIPNTNGKEFWTLSDRGVNVDAANANPAACHPTYDKIYGFPGYAPKIHRIRIQGDSVQILKSITMKRPNGMTATGVINPTGFGSTATELASTDTVLNCFNFNSKIAPKDVWGIDSEGIVVDKDGNFWVCEEGGPSIWKINPQGVVLMRFTPYANLAGAEPQDVQIDTVFKYRKNNRGFEGISITPSGKIYAIIQSPVLYPTKSVGEGTLIHRILEIDPSNNSTRMFAYLNDGIIGASGANQIRLRDWKIGDMAAINDHSFLVLEAALRGTSDIKRMYRIDLTGATPVTSGLYGGKTLEALVDAAGLSANGITPVTKTLFMDLMANGWPSALEKAEGLAILNDSTIAIANDNDYGQVSPLENGIATATTNTSHVFLYRLQGDNKLVDYVPACALTSEEIIGDNNACAYTLPFGDVAEYTINSGYASGYKWVVPAKAVIVSGQGTNTIQVKYFSTFDKGSISVTISSACGGQPLVKTLKIFKSKPSRPVSIVGPASICDYLNTNRLATYTVPEMDGINTYLWIVPYPATIVSGQGTDSITVQFKDRFFAADISVKAIAACGVSSWQSLRLSANCSACQVKTESTIYPVPTQGALTVNFNAASAEQYKLVVKEIISGRVIAESSGTLAEGENSLTPDVSSLKNGYYIINVISGSVNISERIEVRH